MTKKEFKDFGAQMDILGRQLDLVVSQIHLLRQRFEHIAEDDSVVPSITRGKENVSSNKK